MMLKGVWVRVGHTPIYAQIGYIQTQFSMTNIYFCNFKAIFTKSIACCVNGVLFISIDENAKKINLMFDHVMPVC